jgi:hypothetical protein
VLIPRFAILNADKVELCPGSDSVTTLLAGRNVG